MFPKYKNYILFKKKDGWKDLGEIEIDDSPSYAYAKIEVHQFCHTRLRIGKERGEIFKFCPRCMVKVSNNKIND